MADSLTQSDRAQLVDRAKRCRDRLWDELLDEQVDGAFWTGELSSSALSTATAVVALALIDRDRHAGSIAEGLSWLAEHGNADGGYGDTTRSRSNLSTTFLVRAAFAIADPGHQFRTIAERCGQYVDDAGGPNAVLARYGSDRTFSVPILMMGALGGLCDWSIIPRLPFELAVLPRRFYAAVRLPVVSYALPALIAIGQLLHERHPSGNVLIRRLRDRSRAKTLSTLGTLQPVNGGFLEATPLTSFVTMALAAMQLQDHPVARRGTEFIRQSQRADGSWPIDTDLATWVTTLTVNAWGGDARQQFPRPDATLDWLLAQQYESEHPFTGAAPGGWAWTPLPGGVPDADDTAGAVRAVRALAGDRDVSSPVQRGLTWLTNLTNRNGGTPTFCRGWGTLPFDASTPELTAHRLLALESVDAAREKSAHRYLSKQQTGGLWRPLWFGNEAADNEANVCYGTGRILAAPISDAARRAAIAALRELAISGVPSNPGTDPVIEEVAAVLEGIASEGLDDPLVCGSLRWLCERIEADGHQTATPIGLYFANLWYYEQLYPKIFSLAALNRVLADPSAT